MKETENWKMYILLTVVAIGIIAGGIIWYLNYSSYLRTDDAYVTSDNISVGAKILGRISKLYVDEGDSVKVGQLVAELDSMDLLAQKQEIIASKLQTEASKLQAEAKYESDIKGIKVLEIANERATEDFQRAQTQYTGGVTTKEQFEHAKRASESAQAQLDAAKSQLSVSKAQIRTAEATIGEAEAEIGVISTQLNNTRLYAPTTGIVAKRWLLPGDVVQPGQSIFSINDTGKFWVLVYLEETKMKTLHVGQKVKFTIDTYPGVEFTGKVFMISPSTAAQFSLIPPNNASGNFTKVTQRVPIKVSIDATENGKDLSSFEFKTGMSAVVKIIKKS
ncbi:MAG: HlyD family secretion protein [Candidatus Azobacteroides sp.]|nr:HlyD family secretion protein [Candidatus Azobacteroides sp.]